ncbi:hypothetical protein G7Y89_g5687 [Cudoniella acicularis]|uniref:Acyl-protein thioesterase 1 n=1 Tax=Cudoniella acicularis TaxID=354080 RepID=A0A8H4W695_9HELO|nr:hypothetical protein G7Y89_g5687 [Cudoniella acicularis]
MGFTRSRNPAAFRSPPIVIAPPKPSENAPATLIFIHGYNFFASQFNSKPPNQLSVAHHVHQSPLLQHVKVIIPEALPNIHPSMDKNVWYNIATPIPPPGNPLDPDQAVEIGQPGRNEDDMNLSLDYFEDLIRTEVANGTPTNRIVFLGDSQGASILTLFILTRGLASELGAIISYAGFSATPLQSVIRMQQENSLEGSWSKQTKFFLLHGKNDVFVPQEILRVWRRLLESFKDRGQAMPTWFRLGNGADIELEIDFDIPTSAPEPAAVRISRLNSQRIDIHAGILIRRVAAVRISRLRLTSTHRHPRRNLDSLTPTAQPESHEPMAPLHPNVYVDELRQVQNPVYLQYKTQHALLTDIQNLLEEACFYFAKMHAPDLLKSKGWESPEAGELSMWMDALRHHTIPKYAVHFLPNEDISRLLTRVRYIRHTAVHRSRAHVGAIKNMLTDAICLAQGLGDDLRENKLIHVRDALATQDEESLCKVIEKPLKEFTVPNLVERVYKRQLNRVEGMVRLSMANIQPRPPPPPRPARVNPQLAPALVNHALPIRDSFTHRRSQQIQDHYNFRSRKLPTGRVVIDLISDDEDEDEKRRKRPKTPQNVIDLTGDSDDEDCKILDKGEQQDSISRENVPVADESPSQAPLGVGGEHSDGEKINIQRSIGTGDDGKVNTQGSIGAGNDGKTEAAAAMAEAPVGTINAANAEVVINPAAQAPSVEKADAAVINDPVPQAPLNVGEAHAETVKNPLAEAAARIINEAVVMEEDAVMEAVISRANSMDLNADIVVIS